MLGLYVCVCTMSMLRAHSGQKRASHALQLESMLVVSHHMVAGKEPISSARAAGALNTPGRLSSPLLQTIINILLHVLSQLPQK